MSDTDNNIITEEKDPMRIAQLVIKLAGIAIGRIDASICLADSEAIGHEDVKAAQPDTAIPRLTDADLTAIYAFAKRHMMSAIVAAGLEKAGYKDQRSADAIGKALHKAILFENAWNEIAGRLEESGIHYMPLKGVVIKQYYPQPYLREMSDHDILIEPSHVNDVKNIMESLGYVTKEFGIGSHDVYLKQPVYNFEMHWQLFSPANGAAIYDYYKDESRFLGSGGSCRAATVGEDRSTLGSEDSRGTATVGEDRSTLGSGGFCHHMSAEDFYIYIIAHEHKHYIASGTGLRSLLDTCVYLDHVPLDMEYVQREIAKIGLSDFEQRNRSLATHLFTGEPLTEEEDQMLQYIISSGTYGTLNHKVENTIRKYGGNKFRYMLNRFLVPVSQKNPDYAAYALQYPVFYRHKILLPALTIYRIGHAVVSGRFSAEAKALKKV